MSERIMKNFPIEYEGNTYWRSRSVAVVGFVFCKGENGVLHVLANKRGPGCPNEVDKWCVPCGYLDFNEDGQHAVVREIYEETGVRVNPEVMHFSSIEFSKKDEQNVSIRYYTFLSGMTSDYPLTNTHNEKDETTDIQWICIANVNQYEWAFGHDGFIKQILVKHSNDKCYD